MDKFPTQILKKIIKYILILFYCEYALATASLNFSLFVNQENNVIREIPTLYPPLGITDNPPWLRTTTLEQPSNINQTSKTEIEREVRRQRDRNALLTANHYPPLTNLTQRAWKCIVVECTVIVTSKNGIYIH